MREQRFARIELGLAGQTHVHLIQCYGLQPFRPAEEIDLNPEHLQSDCQLLMVFLQMLHLIAQLKKVHPLPKIEQTTEGHEASEEDQSVEGLQGSPQQLGRITPKKLGPQSLGFAGDDPHVRFGSVVGRR